MAKDIEYLDEQFPKGKTKFRGQAMVLLALSRTQGRAEALEEMRHYKNKCVELLCEIDGLKEQIVEKNNKA